MILFQCDYNEGAHPRIMERMMETNLKQSPGYGEDAHCRRAAQLICKACGNDRLAVHFLVGGTQANMTVIDAALRSHQGVISTFMRQALWNPLGIKSLRYPIRTAS